MSDPTQTLAGPNVAPPTSGVEVANITTFENDTVGVEAHRVDEKAVPMVDFVKISGSDSIINFLERPTLLTSGSFTTTDSTTLYQADPFLALVTGSKAPKLNGIYGIKADMRIRVNVNATRFQTGRYIVGFMPSGGARITHQTFVEKRKMHRTTLTNITQLPHVEIDVATQTHVELVIPWLSVAPFFVNLSTYPVGFGELFIYPYVALAAAGTDNIAGYAVWANFENISLTGPAYTQSSKFGFKEAKENKIGPVEATLSKVSKASTILGEFPLLAPVAAGVSWSSDILARAAHVFGWSKPLDMSASKALRVHPLKHFENVDGACTAKTLAAFSTNSLDSQPLNMGTDIDEMSYDFVKQIKAFQAKYVWTASTLVGQGIASIQVTPLWSTSYGNGTVMAPVAFLASLHKLWRGNLRYRFKFVKNEFYSGRIAIVYEPNWLANNISAGLGPSEFNNRIIVDIRETSEVEVEVPYISAQIYSNVSDAIGNLKLIVVDPLVAPDTVPSSISVICETSGAPNLEFACPVQSLYEPWDPFVAQSGQWATQYKDLPLHVLGEASTSKTIKPAEICIGEKLESLRQYWKIPVKALPTNLADFTMNQNTVTHISPFGFQIVRQTTSIVGAMQRGNTFCDSVDLIGACYLFTTGNMRITMADISNDVYALFQDYTSYRPIIYTNVPMDANTAGGKTLVNCSINEPIDVLITPYQKTMGRSTIASSYCDKAGFTTDQYSYFHPPTSLAIIPKKSATVTVNMFRTPADDANAWGWLSVPALVLRTQA